MINKDLMIKAHALTKQLKSEYANINYSFQLGICLKYIMKEGNNKMKIEKGLKFLDYLCEYEVLEFIEDFNMYSIKNITKNKDNELMKKEEIEKHLQHQTEYKEKHQQRKIREIEREKEVDEEIRIQREEDERWEQHQQEQKKRLKEFYGFEKGKTPTQKEEVKRVLNKEFAYKGNVMMKKEVIKEFLEENKEVRCYIDNHHHSKRIKNRIFEKDGSFMELSKLEYAYAKHLLSKRSINAKELIDNIETVANPFYNGSEVEIQFKPLENNNVEYYTDADNHLSFKDTIDLFIFNGVYEEHFDFINIATKPQLEKSLSMNILHLKTGDIIKLNNKFEYKIVTIFDRYIKLEPIATEGLYKKGVKFDWQVKEEIEEMYRQQGEEFEDLPF